MRGVGEGAEEFEVTVCDDGDSRPLPGFHTTRTRTFFVTDTGHVYLVAAPGQRVMLQHVDALPDDAEPTTAIRQPDLWLMARAASSLGRQTGELTREFADFYAWRTRLFLVRAAQVFELRRDQDGVRFELAPALPSGAVPFTEAEAEQLDADIVQAAQAVRA